MCTYLFLCPQLPVQQGPVVPQHVPVTPEAAAAAAAASGMQIPGVVQPSASVSALIHFQGRLQYTAPVLTTLQYACFLCLPSYTALIANEHSFSSA